MRRATDVTAQGAESNDGDCTAYIGNKKTTAQEIKKRRRSWAAPPPIHRCATGRPGRTKTCDRRCCRIATAAVSFASDWRRARSGTAASAYGSAQSFARIAVRRAAATAAKSPDRTSTYD